MTSVDISPSAGALHPQLAGKVAGLVGPRQTVRVVASGEAGGDVVVGRAQSPALARCAVSRRLLLDFDRDNVGFAAALIAAVACRDHAPSGNDPASAALIGLARRVAEKEVSVLIAGPTGTGKEVIARFVHSRSPRRTGPFVAVNCAAIPETMLEASLFGYERGAFTGATASSPGLFRAAAGGTLLLDEVTELPLMLQAKLLRALQEREVMPVGSTVPVRIDARIVATTNRDLASEVAAGRFRADLFYRLAVFPLMTSALAERSSDILPIAAALWLRHEIVAWPTPAALAKLLTHPWPGNVRELGNVIARAAVFAEDGRVTADDVLFDPPQTRYVARSLEGSVREHEFTTIRSTLAACDGHRRVTADRLGISELTLRYKLAAMAATTVSTLQ